MNVTDELRQTIRASIREHLSLLGDLERQRKYERDVPIADVPAELFCVWFDDIYHSESPAHRGAFTLRELRALEEFSAHFDRVHSSLGDVHGVADLHARVEWTQLSVAAAKLCGEIPDALPNQPLQRT